MFYLIGLGLGDPKDITVKGLEIIKACERVYLESYTSILTCGKAALVSMETPSVYLYFNNNNNNNNHANYPKTHRKNSMAVN